MTARQPRSPRASAPLTAPRTSAHDGRPHHPACTWTRTFPDTKRRSPRHRGFTPSGAHVREVHMTEHSRADHRAGPAVAPLIGTAIGASQPPDAEPPDAEITDLTQYRRRNESRARLSAASAAS